MNNDQLKALMNGIGMMTELWTIAYTGFVGQGMSESDAMRHTKSFMSTMMDSFTKADSNEEA